ncbi:hypothetical protein D5086_010672 [Populus alba]|uniref:Uncharacterized protein n=1 Tax=Populus alba TaxID=43335 RepID=A0ACC4CCN5_POPAL
MWELDGNHVTVSVGHIVLKSGKPCSPEARMDITSRPIACLSSRHTSYIVGLFIVRLPTWFRRIGIAYGLFFLFFCKGIERVLENENLSLLDLAFW